jgi:hypothetical protein
MSELRDFLYLDTARLYSFVSQIHGGLISEINETIKQLGGLSAGLNIGIPQLGGKVDASKGKESERQQTRQLTDPAYFSVLNSYLRREKELIDITESSTERRAQLKVGQFIEMRGNAEPPTVEHWITRINSIFEFVERNLKTISKLQPKSKGRKPPTISSMEMRQFKATIDLLIDYMQMSRKDPGKQYIRITSGQQYRIWCGLVPEYITISLQSTLPAEVQVCGRVERLLCEGEIHKIVDLSLFNQASDVDKLLEALNEASSVIGQTPISEVDLQAQYPDIFVTPIAIYR